MKEAYLEHANLTVSNPNAMAAPVANNVVPPQAQATIVIQAPVVAPSNVVQTPEWEDSNMGAGLKRAANSGDEDKAREWQTASSKFQARKPELVAACARSSEVIAVPDFGAFDIPISNKFGVLSSDEDDIDEVGDRDPSLG